MDPISSSQNVPMMMPRLQRRWGSPCAQEMHGKQLEHSQVQVPAPVTPPRA